MFTPICHSEWLFPFVNVLNLHIFFKFLTPFDKYPHNGCAFYFHLSLLHFPFTEGLCVFGHFPADFIFGVFLNLSPVIPFLCILFLHLIFHVSETFRGVLFITGIFSLIYFSLRIILPFSFYFFFIFFPFFFLF